MPAHQGADGLACMAAVAPGHPVVDVLPHRLGDGEAAGETQTSAAAISTQSRNAATLRDSRCTAGRTR
jgi:hypothetical protein